VLSAVVSDLHLGARMSVLGTPPARERLLAQLEEADQVVLLGDVLALRDGAAADVLRAAEPFLGGLREVAAGKRVVLVPGNHDHRLARPVLAAAAREDIGLEQMADPEGDAVVDALARRLDGVELAIAYPGLWIRPDVYAMHGHYLDCHTTVPRVDCLLAAIAIAAVGRVPQRGAAPADYEAVLAPVYDFAYEYAQSAAARGPAAGRDGGLWRRVHAFGWGRVTGGGGGGVQGVAQLALAGVAAAGALGAIGLARGQRFSLDLSPAAFGRAGVRAAAEVVRRLGIDAPHVIFGHTHRAGPLEGDADWATGLVNAGSWAYEPALIGDRGPGDPYWPGHCVLVGDSGPPELRLLLDEPALALS
jgi:predicted phosphodiesterase